MVTVAASILRRMREIDTIDQRRVRVFDSSAVVQAIRTIESAPWVTQLAEIGFQFKSIINQLSTALFPLRELAERFGEASSVRDAFCHYNLWLAPSMSEELLGKVVRLYEAGAGAGTVHSMVSRYYAKENWSRLEEVVERCRSNSLFKSRMNLIEQAFLGHRNGFYDLCVTTLLVHLEGIAADYVKKHKLLPEARGKTKKIILAALKDTPFSILNVRTYAGVGALIEYIELSMFADVDFDKEHDRLHGENRLIGHAVRHGRQVAFGSRMNSLLLFLILDVMTCSKIR